MRRATSSHCHHSNIAQSFLGRQATDHVQAAPPEVNFTLPGLSTSAAQGDGPGPRAPAGGPRQLSRRIPCERYRTWGTGLPGHQEGGSGLVAPLGRLGQPMRHRAAEGNSPSGLRRAAVTPENHVFLNARPVDFSSRSDKQAIDDAVGVARASGDAPGAVGHCGIGDAGRCMSGIHGAVRGSRAG